MTQNPGPAAPVDQLLHRVCRGLAGIGVAVLFACALLTVADIVSRRMLGQSIPGMVDLTQMLVMTAVFLWIPFVFESRGNVEVDLLFERLPAAVRRGLERLWPLFGASFLLLATWHSGRAALQVLEYGDSSPTIGVPMIWYWAPVLFGTVLAAVVCLVQFARALIGPHTQGAQRPGGSA